MKLDKYENEMLRLISKLPEKFNKGKEWSYLDSPMLDETFERIRRDIRHSCQKTLLINTILDLFVLNNGDKKRQRIREKFVKENKKELSSGVIFKIVPVFGKSKTKIGDCDYTFNSTLLPYHETKHCFEYRINEKYSLFMLNGYVSCGTGALVTI